MSNSIYKVWDPACETRLEALELDAMDVDDAAESYMECREFDGEIPDICTLYVLTPEREQYSVQVQVEWCPSYHTVSELLYTKEEVDSMVKP